MDELKLRAMEFRSLREIFAYNPDLCEIFAYNPDLVLIFADAAMQNYPLGDSVALALNQVGVPPCFHCSHSLTFLRCGLQAQQEK